MKKTLVALLAVMLSPGGALAQGLGLDLSDEGQKKQPPPKEQAAPPPPPPVAEEPPPPPQPRQEPMLDEREITQEDRVKAVQRKLYLKTHRFELAGFLGGTVNDPFYAKASESVKLSYFPADALGVGVRFMPLQVYPSDDVARAKSDFHSQISYSVPQYGVMGELEWSAFYGKVTIFNSIVHFDGYILGGLGMVETNGSHLPGLGPDPAAEIGIGLRFAVLDWLAINAAYVNLSFADNTEQTANKSIIQNLQMPMIGVSIFVPFRSTGRESE